MLMHIDNSVVDTNSDVDSEDGVGATDCLTTASADPVYGCRECVSESSDLYL